PLHAVRECGADAQHRQRSPTRRSSDLDADGKYSLAVPARDAVLNFSFIGYISQEIAVDSRTVIDVALVADAQQLDEIVVVGYGRSEEHTSELQSRENLAYRLLLERNND